MVIIPTTDYYQKFEELFPALNKLAPTTATVTSTPSPPAPSPSRFKYYCTRPKSSTPSPKLDMKNPQKRNLKQKNKLKE